jgi:hypothetical protein
VVLCTHVALVHCKLNEGPISAEQSESRFTELPCYSVISIPILLSCLVVESLVRTAFRFCLCPDNYLCVRLGHTVAEQGTGRDDDYCYRGGGTGSGVVSVGQRAGPGEKSLPHRVAANVSFRMDQTGLWLATRW